MKQFEYYQTILSGDIGNPEVQEQLNKYGIEGWELVYMQEDIPYPKLICIFKREVPIEFEEIYKASEEVYNKDCSNGEYCHEQSFKWGFQEGVNYNK